MQRLTQAQQLLPEDNSVREEYTLTPFWQRVYLNKVLANALAMAERLIGW